MQETIEGKTGVPPIEERGRGEEVGKKMEAARQTVTRALDDRKAQLSSGLEQVAEVLESSGDGAGSTQVTRAAARFARRASGMLREHSTEELLDKARSSVNERPGVLIASCFAVGFVAARLLRT